MLLGTLLQKPRAAYARIHCRWDRPSSAEEKNYKTGDAHEPRRLQWKKERRWDTVAGRFFTWDELVRRYRNTEVEKDGGILSLWEASAKEEVWRHKEVGAMSEVGSIAEEDEVRNDPPPCRISRGAK